MAGLVAPAWMIIRVGLAWRCGRKLLGSSEQEQSPRGRVILERTCRTRAQLRGELRTAFPEPRSSSPPGTLSPRAFKGYRCLFLPGEEHAQPEEQRDADSPTGEAGTGVT